MIKRSFVIRELLRFGKSIEKTNCWKAKSVLTENNNLQKEKKESKTIVQDFGANKVLTSCAVKQPGLFTPVNCGNGIGSANERKKCGVEDVQLVFNLLFFQFR